MRLGRGGDDQRVGGGQQRVERQVGRAGFPADRLGALGVGIVNADQDRALRRRDFQRVVAAEMPGAGNADAQARCDHSRNLAGGGGAATSDLPRGGAIW